MLRTPGRTREPILLQSTDRDDIISFFGPKTEVNKDIVTIAICAAICIASVI